jgi:hypothetical protein
MYDGPVHAETYPGEEGRNSDKFPLNFYTNDIGALTRKKF